MFYIPIGTWKCACGTNIVVHQEDKERDGRQRCPNCSRLMIFKQQESNGKEKIMIQVHNCTLKCPKCGKEIDAFLDSPPQPCPNCKEVIMQPQAHKKY